LQYSTVASLSTPIAPIASAQTAAIDSSTTCSINLEAFPSSPIRLSDETLTSSRVISDALLPSTVG
jgi:hypothetical protein